MSGDRGLNSERPLSPHLAHYRWEIGQSTSILHRATGIALAAGLPVRAWWVVAMAVGGAATDWTARIYASWPAKLLLFGWTVAICFHLLNGIRHLGWDSGHGFGMANTRSTGWAAMIGAVALALLIWVFVLFGGVGA